ncbi:MAG: translation initiation factor IF-1 [Acidobacteriota bacterium]|nr:translation initiation factor IF-1 [Acidobacteriota bacterium]
MTEAAGTVVELLPSELVKVVLDGGAHQVLAHHADPVRRNYVRLVVGDRVRIQLMPRDQGRGRVLERL